MSDEQLGNLKAKISIDQTAFDVAQARAATFSSSVIGSFGKIAAAVGIGFGIEKAVSILDQSVKAAMALEVQQRNTGQVFGTSATAVENWSTRSVKAMGLTQAQALTQTNAIGRMLQGLGISQAASSTDAMALQQRIADLASATGKSQDEITSAVEAGLRGRGMALKNYGIDISTATQLNEAHALGLTVIKGKLTDAQKAQVDYSLILKGTTNAAGDFGQTATDKTQQYTPAIEQAKESLGKGLLPVVSQFTDWVGNHSGEIEHFAAAIGQGLGTAGKDLGVVFGWISDHKQDVLDAVAAITGLYALHKVQGAAGSVIGDLKDLFSVGGSIEKGVAKILGIGKGGGSAPTVSGGVTGAADAAKGMRVWGGPVEVTGVGGIPGGGGSGGPTPITPGSVAATGGSLRLAVSLPAT